MWKQIYLTVTVLTSPAPEKAIAANALDIIYKTVSSQRVFFQQKPNKPTTDHLNTLPN